MVTGAVVVSSQATSVRAANLLASFIIIPMALVIQGESAIMFLAPDAESPNGIAALWAIIVGMFVVSILLMRVGNSIFNREELLGRSIDQLNIRGLFKRIWFWIRAIDEKGTPASSLWMWYRCGVFPSVKRLGAALWITIGVFTFGLAAGFIIGNQPEWRLPLAREANFGVTTQLIDNYLNASLPGLPGHVPEDAAAAGPMLDVPAPVNALTFIVWQNGRILLAAALLAIFSFGVAALVLTPAVYVILGYVFSQILLAGYNSKVVLAMVAAVATHGVVEIPVIVLSTAAALRLGAIVTRSPQGVTIGSTWIVALGDTLKIAIGLIIPGLFLAAFIEAFITLRVVLAVLTS